MAGGLIFLVLFLLYFFVVAGQVKRIGSLKREVRKEREKKAIIGEYVRAYVDLVAERDFLQKKLKDRAEDFALNSEVSKIETDLKFPNSQLKPRRESQIHDVYSVSRAEIKYADKSLDEIKNYLYELEKPERCIIVKSFKLEPHRKDRGKFTFNIHIYSVSLIEPKTEAGS